MNRATSQIYFNTFAFSKQRILRTFRLKASGVRDGGKTSGGKVRVSEEYTPKIAFFNKIVLTLPIIFFSPFSPPRGV